MNITAMKYYGGSREKILRLGLADSLIELQTAILVGTFKERLIVRGYPSPGAEQHASSPRLGLVSLLSTRRERLIARILRLRNTIQNGSVDVGVVIVPSSRMRGLAAARVGVVSDLLKVFEQELPEASRVPILVMAVDCDVSRDHPDGC
jgi:hypothetical protein